MHACTRVCMCIYIDIHTNIQTHGYTYTYSKGEIKIEEGIEIKMERRERERERERERGGGNRENLSPNLRTSSKPRPPSLEARFVSITDIIGGPSIKEPGYRILQEKGHP